MPKVENILHMRPGWIKTFAYLQTKAFDRFVLTLKYMQYLWWYHIQILMRQTMQIRGLLVDWQILRGRLIMFLYIHMHQSRNICYINFIVFRFRLLACRIVEWLAVLSWTNQVVNNWNVVLTTARFGWLMHNQSFVHNAPHLACISHLANSTHHAARYIFLFDYR